jgi:hypothetical protein
LPADIWRGAAVYVTIDARAAGQRRKTMAKGQMKSNKEGKKPKSDKPKSSMSEYKKSQGAGGQALSQPGKK